MTSHSITIAKAAFAAACLRPDTVQLTREDVARFHVALESAVLSCTPSNVQTCKNWLVDNVVPSAHRTTALGKYLGSFAKNLTSEGPRSSSGGRDASIIRKRLHILYILNDVLHHAKHHRSDAASKSYLAEGLQTQVADLFQSIRTEGRTRVNRRLEDLLDIWEKEQFFNKTTFSQVKKALSGLEQENGNGAVLVGAVTIPKELPYVMPATHGDPTVPYYDLPAANLMPHIVSNRSIPMRTDQVQALQLSAGPADEGLVNAVKDFLKDVERMENPWQSLEKDDSATTIDELGQVSFRNEADEITGDTYYGWSREFCQKMKKRGQGEDADGKQSRSPSYSRSRSLSRSRSRSFSRSPPKRRRYDESRSRSPLRRSHYRSRSTSESPDRKPATFQQSQPSLIVQGTTNAVSPSREQNLLYPLPPLGPGGLPIPPPRPPNYSGPWPPPPPPFIPHSNQVFPPSHTFSGSDMPPSFAPHSKRY